jgi:hypothetical protein
MSEQQDEKTVGKTDATTDAKADAKAEKQAARADKKAGKDRKGQAKKAAAAVGDGANRVRTLLARIVWAVAVVLALVLALGALLITLDANRQNEAVRFILDAANAVDLGIFSRTDGIKEFTGSNAGVKNALFNWGLGAVAWLVIGKVLDKIIRP